MKLNWKWYSAIFLLVIIISFRLCLPHILLYYAENTLNKIPGYSAKIASIDVNLYRGSYVINQLSLNKVKNKVPEPFFSAQHIDLSVQWKALLNGHFVAKVTINQPIINFVTDPKGNAEQLTIDKQWRTIVTHLFPLNFNQIIVQEGKVHFKSYKSTPPFDLFLKNINGTLDNLREVTKKEKMLPSNVSIAAQTMDGANAKFVMDFDPFAKNPTFKMAVTLENMNIKDTNNLLQHYTNLRVQKGLFSAYSELAAAKGRIDGYIKPIFKNLEIQKSADNPIQAIYQMAASATATILENSEKDTIATKVQISGDIGDPEVSIFSIIGNLLKHGFIQAFLPGIDHSVKMQDVILGKK
jgi:hypothetical protein